MMAEQKKTCRKRLVPFFKEQIGRCPGVRWESEQESMFTVPWRHFKNKNRTDDDNQILKEWAKYTGKYVEGQTDYPKWKTQVRCALNKSSEIRAIPKRDNLEVSNPYRVFQFVEGGGTLNDSHASPGASSHTLSPPSCDNDASQDSINDDNSNSSSPKQVFNQFAQVSVAGSDYLLQQASPQWQGSHNYVQQYTPHNQCQIPTVVNDVILPEYKPLHRFIQPGNPGKKMITSSQFVNYSSPNNASDAQVVPTNYYQITMPYYLNTFSDIPRGEFQHQSMETNSMPSDLRSLPSLDLIPNQEKLPSMPDSFNLQEEHVERNESRQNPVASFIPPSPRDPYLLQPLFTMTLSYGFNEKINVLERPITRQGCNLYSDLYNLLEYRNDPQLFGPTSVTRIEIPSPDICMTNEHTRLNEKYIQNIKELLQNMERGITFTVVNDDLYVQRLCKTRVFVTDRINKSDLLKRDEPPVKIFDSKSKIIEPFIYLTIGQEITRGHSEPLRRVLIFLKIEHIHYKKLYENHEAGMAGDSLLPLISKNNNDDNVVDQLKAMKIHQYQ